MKLTARLVLGLILFTFAYSQYDPSSARSPQTSSKGCRKVSYDFYLLVLTWPGQFCTENACKRNWENDWDKKAFTVHGFWPASTDLSYLACFNDYGYDPNCNVPFKFNQSLFSTYQINQLNKYWPSLSSGNSFWNYQWNKHGTCYLNIIKNEEKSSLPLTEIYRKYFLETVAKAKLLNLSLKPGQKFQSKLDFANKLNLHVSEFYAICGRDNELDELRICFDVYPEPGKQYLTNCPPSRDNQQCKFPIFIK